jgi:hypothetical protein
MLLLANSAWTASEIQFDAVGELDIDATSASMMKVAAIPAVHFHCVGFSCWSNLSNALGIEASRDERAPMVDIPNRREPM